MAESSLSVAYSDLVAEVANVMGFGGWNSTPTGNDLTRVQAIIRRGLTQLYFNSGHAWSFLKPRTKLEAWPDVTGTVSGNGSYSSPSTTITATAAKFYTTMVGHNFTFDTSSTDYAITSVGSGASATTAVTTCVVTGDASGEAADDTFTITADGDYRLPDDFGGMIGPITFDYNEGFDPFHLSAESMIDERRQSYNGTGRPFMGAIKPLSTDGSSGQRFDLMLHPTPDSSYTLHYKYQVLPNTVSSTYTYAYGGAMFSEVVVASCKAVAETETTGIGPLNARYEALVARAIVADRKLAPERLGKNTDRERRAVTAVRDELRYSMVTTLTRNSSSIPGA